MSRQIPQDKALSDEDRAYLESRGRQDLIAQIDDNYPPSGSADEDEGDGSPAPDETGGTSREAEQANLQITEEEPDDDYDSMTNDDLREELEDRDLPTSGNKADLIARLRENDAAQANEGPEA